MVTFRLYSKGIGDWIHWSVLWKIIGFFTTCSFKIARICKGYVTHKFNIILKLKMFWFSNLYKISGMELQFFILFSSDFFRAKNLLHARHWRQLITPCRVFLYPRTGDKHFSWISRSNNLQSNQFLTQVCRLYLVV